MILSEEYREHYRETLRVGTPVILGQIGHMVTALVDNAMIGHYSSVQLAASSLANTMFIMIYIFGVGLALGLTPLTGNALGKEKHAKIALYLKNANVIYPVTGAILMIFMFWSSYYFEYLNQPPEVVDYAVPYFRIISLSMIPFMYFLTLKQFTEGISLTKPAMYAGLAGNILNVILNYVLIYGEFGFPRLELNGAGIATAISRSLMGVFLIIIIYRHSSAKKYIKAMKRVHVTPKSIFELLKVGVPIALQFILEVSAFVGGTIIVGWVGTYSLAAHQIALSLAALTFLSATGIATAATIRISSFLGSSQIEEMKKAGNAAYILTFVFMTLTAIVFIFFGEYLAIVFSTDEEVIQIAVSLLVIAGFFQIVDGGQACGLGVLRGMADVKIPTLFVAIAYWVFGIPMSYYFAIELDLGPNGVWYGFVTGLSTAAILLYIRYKKLLAKYVSAK